MRLIIVGAGGHGSVTAEAAVVGEQWTSVSFLDDQIDVGSLLVGCPIIGNIESLTEFVNAKTQFIVAMGHNQMRDETLSSIQAQGGALASVIHPGAIVSPSASLEPGTVVCAGVVINAMARIGRGSIVNTAATIDHDCVLGRAVHVSPGAHLAGAVTIDDRSWIGIGAVVKEGISIGQDCIIGAGAAVVTDIESDKTVVGVPARATESSC